ncbi:carboxymuconolactone decarboxylase family protein [Variovorax sp. ZT4R33]|uniref:carboxymuconolactone decarboxylase family protein n=1 Tax=Variovorax sp. ZT4R33 TaxID=3443743 RepID=UPI003F46D210
MPEKTFEDAPEAARFPATRDALHTNDQRAAYDMIQQRRGRVPAPYLPLLGSPHVADLLERLSTQLWTGALPARVLEAIFLMTAHRHHCDHQWDTHREKALDAGLTTELIGAIAQGQIPQDGGAVEAAGRFYTTLLESHRVSDEILHGLRHHFGQRGTAELIAFCGVANTVAMLLNVQRRSDVRR